MTFEYDSLASTLIINSEMGSADHQRMKSLCLCCVTVWSGLESSSGMTLSPSPPPMD